MKMPKNVFALFFLIALIGCSHKDIQPPVPTFESCDELVQKAAEKISQCLKDRAHLKLVVTGIRTAAGGTNGLTKHLEEILTTHLAANSKLSVLERKRLKEVYQEAFLSHTDPNYDYKMAVELGKRLSANVMVTSALMKMRNDFDLALRVVDCEKGNILSGCGFLGKFPITPDLSALWLSPVSNGGGFHINARPEGVKAVITPPSGKPYEMRCPFTLKDLASGPYRVVLSKPLYHTKGLSLDVGPGIMTREVKLEPNFGWLSVTSEPGGAKVYLNGNDLGKTPVTRKQKQSKTYKLRVELPRYRDYIGEIIVADGQTRDVHVKLKPAFGTLVFQSTPSGAKVWIDGKEAGTTPFQKEMPSAIYLVSLRKEGFQPVLDERISVSDGRTTEKNYELPEKHGDYNIAWRKTDDEVKAIPLNGVEDYDRRMSIYSDFRARCPQNPYVKKAEQAISSLRVQKASFMSRQFQENFARARDRFVAGDYTAAYQSLEKARKYAGANEKRQIDDLARRYNAPLKKEDRITTFTVNEVSFKMVRIPAGEFIMGSPSDEPKRNEDERQHRVRITKPFWMGQTEVTQGLWQAVMGNNPSYFKNCGDNCPVEMVSWDDCQKFIQKLNSLVPGGGFRLPSEEEWEYACRAGSDTAFSWGHSADCSRANFGNRDSSSECRGRNPRNTMRATSFDPNAWGLYNMHGNVWEWCRNLCTDPKVLSSGLDRMIRGGSWNGSAGGCRSANRNCLSPASLSDSVGFRLASSSNHYNASPEVAKPTDGHSKLKHEKIPVKKETFTVNGVSFKMVRIPVGEFMMGSPSDEPKRNEDERQHRVRITKPFWMGQTEVTQGLWQAVMGNNPSYFKNCGDNCPVEMVSWDDCQKFIQKLNSLVPGGGFRLPSEEEWEYACRAGSDTAFSWGHSADCSRANFGNRDLSSECRGRNPRNTMRATSFDPNAWGLYNMHGNVWEWCRNLCTDPKVLSSGLDRMIRGGSWNSSAGGCRSANRNCLSPASLSDSVGFRLASSSNHYNASPEVAKPTDGHSKLKHEKIPVKKETFTVNGVSFKMVRIPVGEFMMGSPSDEPNRNEDERQHRVRITRPFWMGETEVTQRLWQAVMGNNPSRFSNCGLDCPVEKVSWDDCQKFIEELNNRVSGGGFRLPTEAEWEYACRAGSDTAFSWGHSADCSRANYGNGHFGSECKGRNPGNTMRGKSFDPNDWGLYDMHGNVLEWCQDYWKADYPPGFVTDPEGPSSGPNRVNRGGGWNGNAKYCRSANRIYRRPGDHDGNLGFRLASSSGH